MATARTVSLAVQENTEAWHPQTSAEREAVQEQLGRILASPLFRNSKRYPNLLRFTVERAIEGHQEHLKERVVGIEVFGRDADYDTNADPIVRTTAVEIRKRIAQYYAQPGREGELRIEFPPGSYIAEFRQPVIPWQPEIVPTGPVILPVPERPGSFPRSIVLYGAVALTLVLAGFGSWLWLRSDILEAFWEPVIQAPGEVTIVIPGPPPNDAAGANRNQQPSDRVGFAAANTMAMLTGLLHSDRKLWRVRLSDTATLAELREGPVVLVGAYNNQWTLRLTSPLRFGFEKTELDRRIVDRKNPSQNWKIEKDRPWTALTEDYAVVSRLFDSTTGQYVVVAAGITKYGSTAAGEFLTNPSYMKELSRIAPSGWKGKNLQVVLGTKVVGESSGAPYILATYFW